MNCSQHDSITLPPLEVVMKSHYESAPSLRMERRDSLDSTDTTSTSSSCLTSDENPRHQKVQQRPEVEEPLPSRRRRRQLRRKSMGDDISCDGTIASRQSKLDRRRGLKRQTSFFIRSASVLRISGFNTDDEATVEARSCDGVVLKTRSGRKRNSLFNSLHDSTSTADDDDESLDGAHSDARSSAGAVDPAELAANCEFSKRLQGHINETTDQLEQLERDLDRHFQRAVARYEGGNVLGATLSLRQYQLTHEQKQSYHGLLGQLHHLQESVHMAARLPSQSRWRRQMTHVSQSHRETLENIVESFSSDKGSSDLDDMDNQVLQGTLPFLMESPDQGVLFDRLQMMISGGERLEM